MTERRFRVERELAEGVEPELAAGARLTLASAAAKHARVLRLSVGAPIVLFDGRGGEADAVIVSIDDEVTVEVRALRSTREAWRVVLVVGLPKAAVLESLLRGATEAGASEIRLFEAERSVVHAEGDRAAKKLERWARIVEEAARQSERALVPELSLHRSLGAAITDASGVQLVALDARRGDQLSLGGAERPSMIVVGPEGGLSDGELDAVVSQGGRIVRLALPVMRVETAAVVATALAALSAA